MRQRMMSCLFILISLMVNAQTINVRGVVSTKAGKPISNAIVTLVRQGLKDTTGRDGAYSIVKHNVAVLPAITPDAGKISLDKGVLHFSLSTPSALKVEIFDLQGNLLKKISSNATADAYRLKIMDNSLAAKLLFIRVSAIGRGTVAFRYLSLNSGKYTVNAPGGRPNHIDGSLARVAAVNDTLKTMVAGFITKTLPISSYDQVVNITPDSVGGADSYEPDNSRESASTLAPLGTAQTHTLTVGDTDWVKFTADSGVYYLVQINNTSLVQGYLYYANNTSPSMEFGGTTVGGSLKWRFPKSGTWYAQIFPSHPGQTGVYTFNVSAKWVFFTSPIAKAEWTAGNSYPIEWSSNVSLGSAAHLNLFKGSHQVLGIGDNPKQNDTITWNVPQGMATGKDYRLGLDWSFSDTFSIIGLEPDKYEPDDILNDSLPDIHGTEIHTLTVNDTDWFKYWSTPEGVLVIKATPSSSSMPLRLDCYPNACTVIPVDSSVVLATSTTGVVFKITSSSFGSYSIANQFRNTREDPLVTSPAGGSSWSIGQTVPIKWNSVRMGGTVTIQFANNSYRPTVSSVPDTGTYLWTIDSTFTPYQNNYVQVTGSLHGSLYGVGGKFAIIDK